MKRMVYGAVALSLAVAFTSSLWAEEGHREKRREGGDGEKRREGGDGEKRREGGDGENAGAQARDLSGTFSKNDGGALLFKTSEGTFFVVAGDKADEGTKEKLKNADSVLVGKGVWQVRGMSKKSGDKLWLAADSITKREGDGERKKEGGDGERRKEGGDHKEGGDRR